MILQVPLTLLFALITDGGRLFLLWTIAIVAFWVGVLLARYRRPNNPTRVDLLLIRWGTVPLMVVTAAIAKWIWQARGGM